MGNYLGYKKPNWVSLCDDIIQEYSRSNFKWGERDCLCFAADLVSAQSDVDIMRGTRGQYTTEEQARSLISSIAGDEWGVLDYWFSRVPKMKGQRGDVGIVDLPVGLTFGVLSLDGRTFLVKKEGEGLVSIPLFNTKFEITLWRVECLQ